MTTVDALRARLASDLRQAMKSRNAVERATLRALLATLDNASAVPLSAPEDTSPDARLDAAFASAASSEVPRREVTADECRDRIDAEARERREAAALYDRLQRHADADRARAELAIVERYLSSTR